MKLMLALLLAAAPPAKVDAKLVGAWGAPDLAILSLRADGTGKLEKQAVVKWTADGTTLTLTDDRDEVQALPYRLEGGKLVLTLGGQPLELQHPKPGAAMKRQAKAPQTEQERAMAYLAAQGFNPGAEMGNEQMGLSLTFSAWCTGKVKLTFEEGGFWGEGPRRGRWQVRSGRLFMSEGNVATLKPVRDFSSSEVVDGNPALKLEGKTYVSCN